MTKSSQLTRRGAFTMLELAIVAVVITVLAILILATATRPHHSRRQYCGNNLRQISLSFRIFANDNQGKLPWEVSTNQRGSREFMAVPFSAFRHFQAISNELFTPRVIVCPADLSRAPATNWGLIGNRALSYFVGLDTRAGDPLLILSGDRFLGSTRAPSDGLLTLSPQSLLWWTNSPHAHAGNVAMGDGSVQQVNSRGLLQALRNSGLATNRLALPLIRP